MAFHLGNTINRLLDPATPFITERQGNNTHCQDIHILASLGNHRGSTGSGTTAHPGSDKHHLGRWFNDGLHIVDIFNGCFPANLGLITGASPLGERCPQLNTQRDWAVLQGLGIGIAHHKTNIFYPLMIHVVHCVATTSSNTDYLNDCPGGFFQIEIHNIA